MKKMKYLLPLLTATATVGAIAPLAVSCNKGEPEPEPAKTYTVKLADSDEGIEFDKKEVTEKEKVDITLSWKNKEQKIETLTVKTGETTLKLTDDYTTDASIAGKLKISIKEGKVVGDVVITAKFGQTPTPVVKHIITITGDNIMPIDPIEIEDGMGLAAVKISALIHFKIVSAEAKIGSDTIPCKLDPSTPSQTAILSIEAQYIKGDVTVTITTEASTGEVIGHISFDEYSEDNWVTSGGSIVDYYKQGQEVWDTINVGDQYTITALGKSEEEPESLVPLVHLEDGLVADDVVQIIPEGAAGESDYIDLKYTEDYEFEYTADLNSITFKVLSIDKFKSDGEFLENFTLQFKIDVADYSFELSYFDAGIVALPKEGITFDFGIGYFDENDDFQGQSFAQIASGEPSVRLTAAEGVELALARDTILYYGEKPFIYITAKYEKDEFLWPGLDETFGYPYLYVDGEFRSLYFEEEYDTLRVEMEDLTGKSQFTYFVSANTSLHRIYQVPLVYDAE